MQFQQRDPKFQTIADLNHRDTEHYVVAQSLREWFSPRKYKDAYLRLYPERKEGSILPSDYCFNRDNKGNLKHPRFLEWDESRSYRFVGLDGSGDSQASEALTTSDGHLASELAEMTNEVIQSGYFSADAVKDERTRILRAIVERRGQPEFRKKLISAYNGCCAVTQYNAVAALEAAHIRPYSGPQSDHVTNGLLLRADIHTLFDLDLLGIDPDGLTICLAPFVKESEYAHLQGVKLTTPVNRAEAPSQTELSERWTRFCTGDD